MPAPLKQSPLSCPGHSRPVVDIHFSDETDCGSLFVAVSKVTIFGVIDETGILDLICLFKLMLWATGGRSVSQESTTHSLMRLLR
ncbi:hypothetical protein D915_011078 [Fasciola hepatica]|uniref:Uncharacterized protein n=1 Tax=Fasciola hepatica TaxID=6192 RepID=A0A4E0RNP0_FASHE|nr:hypothetical protein D915_011078 [Fasciola hepatica]